MLIDYLNILFCQKPFLVYKKKKEGSAYSGLLEKKKLGCFVELSYWITDIFNNMCSGFEVLLEYIYCKYLLLFPVVYLFTLFVDRNSFKIV